MAVRKTRNPVQTLGLWFKRQPPKVKAFLSVIGGIVALVFLRFVVKDHDNLFVGAETVHSIGILVLVYKLLKEKTCAGEVGGWGQFPPVVYACYLLRLNPNLCSNCLNSDLTLACRVVPQVTGTHSYLPGRQAILQCYDGEGYTHLPGHCNSAGHLLGYLYDSVQAQVHSHGGSRQPAYLLCGRHTSLAAHPITHSYSLSPPFFTCCYHFMLVLCKEESCLRVADHFASPSAASTLRGSCLCNPSLDQSSYCE